MNHTKTLSDNIVIFQNLARSGNNINLTLGDEVTAIATAPEIYKIIRIADTAFARTDYP
jgi:hypothetical protein